MLSLEQKIKDSKQMYLNLTGNMSDKMEKLKKLIEKHPGNTQVYLNVKLDEIKQKVTMKITDPKGVQACKEFFDDLNTAFGTTDFVEIG